MAIFGVYKNIADVKFQGEIPLYKSISSLGNSCWTTIQLKHPPVFQPPRKPLTEANVLWIYPPPSNSGILSDLLQHPVSSPSNSGK